MPRTKSVRTVERLAKLADERRSVWHPNWGIKPAVVIMNMPATLVMAQIRMRKLIEYRPIPANHWR